MLLSGSGELYTGSADRFAGLKPHSPIGVPGKAMSTPPRLGPVQPRLTPLRAFLTGWSQLPCDGNLSAPGVFIVRLTLPTSPDTLGLHLVLPTRLVPGWALLTSSLWVDPVHPTVRGQEEGGCGQGLRSRAGWTEPSSATGLGAGPGTKLGHRGPPAQPGWGWKHRRVLWCQAAFHKLGWWARWWHV